jgi:molecular chaperone GrpE
MRSDRTEEERSPHHGEDGAPNGNGEPDASPGSGGEQEMGAAGAAGADDLSQEGARDVRATTSEAEELRDRYLRLAAEFENYRKRTERERSEHSVRAQGKLVQSLLDAIDDLERVADFTPETTTVAALLEGVQMVERKVLRALESAGLEVVDAHGTPFDPTHHEALMTAATDHAHEDETVGEVFQKGYRFQGHLLRPARVQVRKHEG